MTHKVEFLPCVRQRPLWPAWSKTRLLMTWQQQPLGHQQPWISSYFPVWLLFFLSNCFIVSSYLLHWFKRLFRTTVAIITPVYCSKQLAMFTNWVLGIVFFLFLVLLQICNDYYWLILCKTEKSQMPKRETFGKRFAYIYIYIYIYCLVWSFFFIHMFIYIFIYAS